MKTFDGRFGAIWLALAPTFLRKAWSKLPIALDPVSENTNEYPKRNHLKANEQNKISIIS